MTIASEITKLNTNLTNSYTAVSGKGGTLPQAQNFDNLATAVSSITELKGETRSVSLTSSAGNTFTPLSGKNGITSITVTPNNEARTVTPTTSSQSLTVNSGYSGNGTITVNAVTSSIDANITAENIKKDVSILGVTGTYEGSGSSGIGIPREVTNNYYYSRPQQNYSFSLPSDALYLDNNALEKAFVKDSHLIEVSFPEIHSILLYGLYYTFDSCRNLTSANFPELSSIDYTQGMSYTFINCSALTSISFPMLDSIQGNNAMSYTFRNCTGLTSVSFPALTTTSFGSDYTNQFTGMMTGTGTSKTHTIHFPSNMESTISELTGYPNFGGTNGYIVLSYDLPATS